MVFVSPFCPMGMATDSGQQKYSSGRRPTCQVCGKLGHTALVCYYRFDQTYQHDGLNPTADTAAAAQFQDLNWYPNIGANHHISSDLSNLNIHSEEYDGFNLIQVGNGTGQMKENP
jgi:hypothetical protein